MVTLTITSTLEAFLLSRPFLSKPVSASFFLHNDLMIAFGDPNTNRLGAT